MATIREQPLQAAAVWVRTEHARLTPEQVAEMIVRPENEWTTTPRRVMDFLAFMRGTGAVAQQADSWRDLFFPEVHGLDGG